MKKSILTIPVLLLLLACNNGEIQADKADDNAKEEDLVETPVSDDNEASPKATFVHTVFFWMKEDLSSEEAKFFEEGMEKLGKTPSILSYKWGKPAGTPRDVVDNSYTYAWIVDFASVEDQDAYQVDPIHLQFIEESKDLWTKVQVYDTILE